MWAARQRSRSACQEPSGRYRSLSRRVRNAPQPTARWTETIQLSCLPEAPQCWRCTPGVLFPLLGDAGLVDLADHAQPVGGPAARGRQVLAGDAALDVVAHPALGPAVVGEEPL